MNPEDSIDYARDQRVDRVARAVAHHYAGLGWTIEPEVHGPDRFTLHCARHWVRSRRSYRVTFEPPKNQAYGWHRWDGDFGPAWTRFESGAGP